MKTIGLLGGMSWESMSTYYQIINTLIKERTGGRHSAQCLLFHIDFHQVEECLLDDDWDKCAEIFVDGAKRLEKGGADFIVLCTNTMHRVSDDIAKAVSIPLVHIADATGDVLQKLGVKKVGLLGTRYTMEQDFNTAKLVDRGMEVLVPDEEARMELNRIIFEELCQGVGKDSSREFVLDIVGKLARRGVDGVILGCAELGLLLDQEDTYVPLIDAMSIHATRAAGMAMTTDPAKQRQERLRNATETH